MTEIAFHFNASDKLAYTCRLLRKAVASGAQVVVTAEPPTLQQLDVALWTFSALDFLPHWAAPATPGVLARSPIVLTGVPADAPHQQVLVNLSDNLPDGFERFERLIEVVSGDAADRQAARQRWKHYADRGYAIVRHDVMQKESA
ncbi:MAG: DNA polymerase III subunit chi [Burkholderiaceae bacterium]|nr:DNA polymerase III subunit chi [Burkholderiaceae bacterium]